MPTPFAWVLFGILAAAAASGLACRGPKPDAPPPCPHGLDYLIRPSVSEPGRLVVHTLRNCSPSTTWWLNGRFATEAGPYRNGAEVEFHISDQAGIEAEQGCMTEYHFEDPTYFRTLRPNHAIEFETSVFYCTNTTFGSRYRVFAVYRDASALPPPAPAGAKYFADEVRSNTLELTNQDHEWVEDEYHIFHPREDVPAATSGHRTRKAKR
jgi:hypothetical protein